MSKESVEVKFGKPWRGHKSGSTASLTPIRAVELHGSGHCQVTSTGQAVLTEQGFALSKRKTAKKADTPPAKPTTKKPPAE